MPHAPAHRRMPHIRPHEHGPFDIIGDVHGCCDELETLLHQLGYRIKQTHGGLGLDAGPLYGHPEGRKAVFLGDLVDRGPRILDTLRLIYRMVRHQTAFCVLGNHDDKFLRKLMGRNVQIKHGLETTMAQLDALPPAERRRFEHEAHAFLTGLPVYSMLDDNRLVVAHAGLKEPLHGKTGAGVRAFALYGETTGQTDAYGLPVRLDWAACYRGKALVVYGHTPTPEPRWENNTVNIDTGCIFGGKLTALRYPERTLVSVPARQVYTQPPKPFPSAVADRE